MINSNYDKQSFGVKNIGKIFKKYGKLNGTFFNPEIETELLDRN